MRIAVASDEGMVAAHFGYCEAFLVFDTDNRKIVKTETVQNPGHRPGFLPRYLHEQGVKTMISGGMGSSAVQIFNENDIEVIVGVKGSARKVVQDYLEGKLESTGTVCHEHQHEQEGTK
ncbi:MAG: NifB/NifX family molybdenum-iron cluster-binding protein [Bacillota bacterium]|nr:NifB/NifX family molybdenum-iron cluster-binding protein [Bacillota bacterium]